MERNYYIINMKITKQGDKFIIEVNDKELELLCDGMDLKETEERKMLMQSSNISLDTYGVFGMIKELARNFHNAFMGNIR